MNKSINGMEYCFSNFFYALGSQNFTCFMYTNVGDKAILNQIWIVMGSSYFILFLGKNTNGRLIKIGVIINKSNFF